MACSASGRHCSFAKPYRATVGQRPRQEEINDRGKKLNVGAQPTTGSLKRAHRHPPATSGVRRERARSWAFLPGKRSCRIVSPAFSPPELTFRVELCDISELGLTGGHQFIDRHRLELGQVLLEDCAQQSGAASRSV